jgi:hypothetical protein
LVALAIVINWRGQTALAIDGDLAGVYADQQLRVELKSDDGVNYSGTINKGGQVFPLAARAEAAAGIGGTFESGGQRFPFHAQADRGKLVLDTGGAHYELNREPSAGAAVNPLAPPPPPAQSAPLTGSVGSASPAPPAAAKDPLAYRTFEFPGGSVAKFDHWQYAPPVTFPGGVYVDGCPTGRQADFVMRSCMAIGSEQDVANLFTAGPALSQQVLAQLFGPDAFNREGEPTRMMCGGDEAMVEAYTGAAAGRSLTCRVMYVKRKDVAIAVLGIGTDAGFKQFGRAVEIVAQSISLKESALEPALIGTWTLESYASAGTVGSGDRLNVASSRSITFFPNGMFTDSAQTGFAGDGGTGLAQGGNRGTVVKRGNILTFKYDNGSTWSPMYELFSNGMKIDEKVYLKQ